MSEPTPPKASPHHNYQSWTSTYRDDNGRSRAKRFGRVGKVPRALAVSRWKTWLSTEYVEERASHAIRYSVNQLCKDFFAEMEKGYSIDGKPTATINRVKVALESFGNLYGAIEADDMTAGRVAGWLEEFIKSKRKMGGKGPKTKETVNLALNYVKRMYQWGATYKGVSAAAAGSVVLVRNVRADHSGVRRKERVKSVPWETVEATAKHLPAAVKAMVELMWWTGMRPGEVRSLRPCDIDVSRDVWVYTPARHKNTWRGKARHVPIGPRGIKVIAKLLPAKTDELVFRREDGKGYTRQDVAKAIAKAAALADVEAWAPNRIRHSFATRVRLGHGAQAVQDLLGHAQINQQMVYVDDAVERAVKISREVG